MITVIKPRRVQITKLLRVKFVPLTGMLDQLMLNEVRHLFFFPQHYLKTYLTQQFDVASTEKEDDCNNVEALGANEDMVSRVTMYQLFVTLLIQRSRCRSLVFLFSYTLHIHFSWEKS